ncbi:MAG: amino acid permease, partial [Arenibacter algicola]|nr:amino acid permease [Arenibacter algicola]
ATLVVGAVVFALTTLVAFEPLARLTSALLLLIFLIVNLSLLRLKKREPNVALTLRIPGWVPALGALSAVGLLAAEVVHMVGG